MEQLDEQIFLDQFGKIFRQDFIKEKILPYSSIIYAMMNSKMSIHCCLSLEHYLNYLMRNPCSHVSSNSPICFYIAQEMKESAKDMSVDELYSEYTCIAKMFVKILFKEFLQQEYDYSTATEYKKFGIRKIEVTMNQHNFLLQFDNCRMVYENRRHNGFDILMENFLNRIVKLSWEYFSYENKCFYNLHSGYFFKEVARNKSLHWIRVMQFFRIVNKERLHICVIIIWIDEKRFFATAGFDVHYYLCAEAKAMQKATEIIQTEKATEFADNQFKEVVSITETINQLNFYGLNREEIMKDSCFLKVNLNEKRYFYVALFYASYSLKTRLVSAINTRNKKSVENVLVKNVTSTIRQLEQEDFDDDFFAGF